MTLEVVYKHSRLTLSANGTFFFRFNSAHRFWFLVWCGRLIYSVSQKNTPDIFSCNLNKYVQISIIFGINIT